MALVNINHFGNSRFHSNTISQSQPVFEVADSDNERAKKQNIKPLHLTVKHNLCSKENVKQQKKWLKLSQVK